MRKSTILFLLLGVYLVGHELITHYTKMQVIRDNCKK